MSSELTLGGVPVTVRISPRARRMRLKVDPRTRSVLLTVPRRVSERRAMAWAGQHEQWVMESVAAIPEAVAIAPGSTIPLYGFPHRIDWHPSKPRRIELDDGLLRAGGPLDTLERRVLRWLSGEALRLLASETREAAAKAGAKVASVRVGDPVSRWGSCSSVGAIRYSWRLIMAPEFVRRATVAHEVAHLVHMHHGHAFHALVKELLGADPSAARDWLRREGGALHRVGRRG